MIQLYKVADGRLVKATRKPLALEDMIQSWVASDLRLVGLDGLVLGQKVRTDHDKEIDILAMDRDGGLIIIELKRDRTPREIVAQVLDYASWVCKLTTNEVYDIARRHLLHPLAEAFQKHFNESIPDTLNSTHQMLIVASEFDEASERIVEYLSEEHDVGINASFFNVFEQDGSEWIKTFDRPSAKSFNGIFANQNPVWKIYKQDTVDFLVREFGLADGATEAHG